MRPRAVSFDLDDTLYPEAEFVVGGLAAAAEALHRSVGRDIGAGRAFLEALEAGGPARVLSRGLERLGLPADDDLLGRLVQAFRAHAPSLAPFPGVVEMLQDLRCRGLRLALITDGRLDVQRRKWSALRLAPFFDAVVFTDDVEGRPCPKPDPSAFRLVERLLSVSGAEVVHVGDTPARDFPPAEACGWRTVRVRYPGGYHALDPDPREADRPQARSVSELHRILISMVGGQGSHPAGGVAKTRLVG